MKKLRYAVKFLTPCFLGNADQDGQWRTPPFKAQLRQWWRVAYAADKGFTVDAGTLRREEGLLFGNAWLESGGEKEHCRSLVQIRINHWKNGGCRKWTFEMKDIYHPEVTYPPRAHKEDYKVGPHAYLGYGPLDGRGGTKLSRSYAIDAGETAELRIRVPDEVLDEHAEILRHTLTLMHGFGALGGRCRNGWGAYSLEALAGSPELPDFRDATLHRFFRPWRDCLDKDWPHAIGCDDGLPLVWTTAPRSGWRDVLRDLALVRMGVRTQFVFTGISPDKRHWLAYPVTKHSVNSWGNDSRLPNTLRFTVRPAGNGKVQGVIFHMPCMPPSEFKPEESTVIAVWQTVHALLNELTKPTRERGYAMIADAKRRDDLQPHLDEITIQRCKGGCS